MRSWLTKLIFYGVSARSGSRVPHRCAFAADIDFHIDGMSAKKFWRLADANKDKVCGIPRADSQRQGDVGDVELITACALLCTADSYGHSIY